MSRGELWLASEDGGDQTDIEMARGYLARICDPVLIGAGIAQGRDAAERLVRTEWGQDRIRLIAGALLKRGSLNGSEKVLAMAPSTRDPLRT